MEEDSDVSRIFEFSRQIGWSKHQLISLNPNNLILFVSIHHTNEAPSQLFNTSCNCIIDDRVTIEIAIHQRPIGRKCYLRRICQSIHPTIPTYCHCYEELAIRSSCRNRDSGCVKPPRRETRENNSIL